MAGVAQVPRHDYLSFKHEFCRNFLKEEDIKKLMFCLCDHLDPAIMFQKNLTAQMLLNNLEIPKVKSPSGEDVHVFSKTRVNLLKEISDLINVYSANKCVIDYIEEKKKIKLDVSDGESLKPFRKVFYEAMVASGPKQKIDIVAYYNTEMCKSKWDVILYLENEGELTTRRDLLVLSRNLTGVGQLKITDGMKKLFQPNDDGQLSVIREKKDGTVSLSFVARDDDILKELVQPQEGVEIPVIYQDTSEKSVESKECVERSVCYVKVKKGTISECPAPQSQAIEKKDVQRDNESGTAGAGGGAATDGAGGGAAPADATAGVTADGNIVRNTPGTSTALTNEATTGSTDDQKISSTSSDTGEDNVDATVPSVMPTLSKFDSNTKKHKTTAKELL